MKLSKAKQMTKKERESATRRKRAKKQGVGGKPTNVKTDDEVLSENMRKKKKK